MTDSAVPKLPKWPFYVADALLLAVVGYIVFQSPRPFDLWTMVVLVSAVISGAWLCVTPFLTEYGAAIKFAESHELAESVAEIKNLQAVAEQISMATAQWQSVQEASSKTAAAAQNIGERMTLEAEGFRQFFEKANEGEKTHLRLEVEKLRRAEGDWLQILVRILDHVFALFQAAVQSRQASLIEQIGNFQNACRDVARRVGLVVLVASPGEHIDGKIHQVLEADGSLPDGSIIAEMLAPGYTFQGQLLRRAVVKVQLVQLAASESPEPIDATAPNEPAAEPALLETETVSEKPVSSVEDAADVGQPSLL